jgi:hypothetical protein
VREYSRVFGGPRILRQSHNPIILAARGFLRRVRDSGRCHTAIHTAIHTGRASATLHPHSQSLCHTDMNHSTGQNNRLRWAVWHWLRPIVSGKNSCSWVARPFVVRGTGFASGLTPHQETRHWQSRCHTTNGRATQLQLSCRTLLGKASGTRKP